MRCALTLLHPVLSAQAEGLKEKLESVGGQVTLE